MGAYKIMRGDTFELNLTVLQQDGSTPWPSLDTTKIWSTIKKQLNDPDSAALSQVVAFPASSSPVGGVITVKDVVAGILNIRHAPSMTLALEGANVVLFYDVQIKCPDGRVFTIDHGTVAVVPDITQSET